MRPIVERKWMKLNMNKMKSISWKNMEKVTLKMVYRICSFQREEEFFSFLHHSRSNLRILSFARYLCFYLPTWTTSTCIWQVSSKIGNVAWSNFLLERHFFLHRLREPLASRYLASVKLFYEDPSMTKVSRATYYLNMLKTYYGDKDLKRLF